jgi:hypothetical protein
MTKGWSKPKLKQRNYVAWLALFVSSFLAWLTYATSLPALSIKVELVDPLAAVRDIHVRVNIDNDGKTPAKQLHPALGFKFAPAGDPFKPDYENALGPDPNWVPTTSDLPASGHTTIYSTNHLSLAHEHDVNMVVSGEYNFFVYGKIPYKDILHISHEAHFCGQYREIPGADPLKFSYCPYYNED